MKNADIRKKLDEAKAWIGIMEESQKTREKYGQPLAIDFQLELGNDSALARNVIADLEKEVYGGFLNSLRRRVENAERTLLVAQEGTRSSDHE